MPTSNLLIDPPITESAQPPLFVELDGTLIATDSLLECLILCVKHRPLDLLKIPKWLPRGRAYIKARLAEGDLLDVARLPYRKDLCEYLRRERANGRAIYLATGANERIARRVAGHLGLFDAVIASDSCTNMHGARKLETIREIAPTGFTYAGNSRSDHAIRASSQSAILVNAPPAVEAQIERSGKLEKVFRTKGNMLAEMVGVARLHQWLKNMLVFVPPLTSFQITESSAVFEAIIAFFAFSFCASATYAANDILDVQNDRSHPRKRLRPLASGRLPIPVALGLGAATLGTGLALAGFHSFELLAVIVAYIFTTTVYSWYLKTRVLIDVIVLAGLYTLRIMGGAVAISVPMSIWLLAFSLFVFLSLALIKRCSELITFNDSGVLQTPGRNYQVDDLKVLWPIGLATAVASVLVFALYLTSTDLLTRYGAPSLLWFVALGLFYWLTRMWIKTARGEMSDDPLVYALRDFGSRTIITGIVILTLAAHFLKLS